MNNKLTTNYLILIIAPLLPVLVFCTSCKGQNKAEPPKTDTRAETESVIISQGPNLITRNIIQDKKGNIWIAAFDGIFRYDGKSFTKLQVK